MESLAAGRLLSMLPEDLRGDYAPLLSGSAPGDAALLPLVKAADKLSAVIKCIEGENRQPGVPLRPRKRCAGRSGDMHLPEADLFVQEFLPAFEQSLDEYTR